MGNLKGWPPKYDEFVRIKLSFSQNWFNKQLELTKTIFDTNSI